MPLPVVDAPERAVVRAVNQERAARGLPGLRVSRGLSRVAGRHSGDQLRQNRLSHVGSDGSRLGRRVARVGRFARAGEVLAFAPRGSSTRGAAIVRMWMASPPHRARVLDPGFRLIGVGRVKGALGASRGVVVTADLARR